MRKLMLPALFLLVAGAAAQAQSPGYYRQDDNAHYAWADVLRVDPVYESVRVEQPRQECYDQPVVRQDNGGSTAGTVIGAIVGGALGHTVGKGDGRKAATVGGAVIGGAIGNRAGRGGTYTDNQTVCRDVSAVRDDRRVVGYDVEYRFRGETYVSRLDYDPGERLRVRVSVTPAE